MIYLLSKYDIISVPSYAESIYHRLQSGIILKIYHPFRKERISLKNALAKASAFFWHILHILIQCNAVSPSVAFVKWLRTQDRLWQIFSA